MDAVKALLSMKSRTSSMPLASPDSSTPKKGRRKQLFKTPTKQPLIQDHDDYGSPKSDEIDLGELEDEEEEEEVDEPAGKLLVKFPSFQRPKRAVNDDDEELELGEIKRRRDDEDEEDDDEPCLEIDDREASNPLLELSRAACLVEDHTVDS